MISSVVREIVEQKTVCNASDPLWIFPFLKFNIESVKEIQKKFLTQIVMDLKCPHKRFHTVSVSKKSQKKAILRGITLPAIKFQGFQGLKTFNDGDLTNMQFSFRYLPSIV